MVIRPNILDEVGEHVLAHKLPDEVEAAYLSCHKKVTMCTSVLISSINKLSPIF